MNRIARILIVAVSGLTLLPLATAGGPEPTAAGPTAQASPPPGQVGTQPVLRPYYVVPFFPFLWPVPPGHPAATPPQAGQTPAYPAYPFVIWLPAQAPAQVGTIVPPALEAPATQPVTGSAVAPVQPTPPQAPAAAPAMQERAGPLTVSGTPPQPEAQPSPLPKEPEPAPEARTAAEPAAEPVVAKETPPKEGARPGAASTVKPKPGATRPAPVKPAQKRTPDKRKLCWKDGKLDVCK
jgi:hypothetical protein